MKWYEITKKTPKHDEMCVIWGKKPDKMIPPNPKPWDEYGWMMVRYDELDSKFFCEFDNQYGHIDESWEELEVLNVHWWLEIGEYFDINWRNCITLPEHGSMVLFVAPLIDLYSNEVRLGKCLNGSQDVQEHLCNSARLGSYESDDEDETKKENTTMYAKRVGHGWVLNHQEGFYVLKWTDILAWPAANIIRDYGKYVLLTRTKENT